MAEEEQKSVDERVERWIEKFEKSKSLKSLEELYLTKSFPEILGVERREEIHSAFLAWLLDKNKNHGLDDFPIKKFLEILVDRDEQQHKIKNHQFKNTGTGVLKGNFTINDDMSVKRERPANTSDKKGRMDIWIDMKANFSQNGERNIHIVIENKVYSKEHGGQTKTYFASRSDDIKNNSNDIYLFVYLTPSQKSYLDNLSEPECDCKEYIQINYQDLLDEILEPALKNKISRRNKIVIQEYINCLGLPAIDINSSKSNVNLNTIMAMSNETKEKLKDFWKKHEKLLIVALSSLADNTDDEKIQDIIKSAISAINERDKTSYEFNGKSDLGKMDLVTEVVSEILKHDISASDCNSLYEDALKNIPINGRRTKENKFKAIESAITGNGIVMTCNEPKKIESPFSGELVLSSEEYNQKTNNKKYNTDNYKCVKVDNNDYYILKQWGANNIDNFVYAFYDEHIFDETYKWEGLKNKDFKVNKPQISD